MFKVNTVKAECLIYKVGQTDFAMMPYSTTQKKANGKKVLLWGWAGEYGYNLWTLLMSKNNIWKPSLNHSYHRNRFPSYNAEDQSRTDANDVPKDLFNSGVIIYNYNHQHVIRPPTLYINKLRGANLCTRSFNLGCCWSNTLLRTNTLVNRGSSVFGSGSHIE